ncbi:MAG: FMN-binding protein [Eubacteriales bacterium]|nr:FMN-binding protein [Eubacteriales bacterium]
MKQREKTVSILDRLSWSVQPPRGLVKGNYYREEARFSSCFNGDLGHLGILEAVTDGDRIVMVEFNEQCSPTYYIRRFQNADKRLSDYGFFQASKERTATTGVVLVNGITSVEAQMVSQNRLTGEFDLVAGASNSIRRSMLPLAEKIAERLDQPSGQLYYGLSKELEPGVTGRLQLVIENSRIIRFFYDEIFADSPEEIENPELKPYYRQSKYHCPEYISTSGAGFNSLSDLLSQSVLTHQELLGLKDLPYTEDENRAPEWDRYLLLANEIQKEMLQDGIRITQAE